MIDFFRGQLDYILFFYGLACVTLASVCFYLGRGKGQRLPWIWLGLFASGRALHQCLALFSGNPGLVDLAMWQVICSAISFLFLFEFGRASFRVLTGRGPGRAVLLPLLALTAAGGFWGLSGLDISSRYLLGFGGGLAGSYAILKASGHNEDRGRGWLKSVGVFIGLYSLSIGIVVPQASFPPASFLNNEIFFRVMGFPVQLLRALFAVCITVSVWGYLQSSLMRVNDAYGYYSGKRRIFVPVVLLVAIVAGGWVFTEFAGGQAKEEEIRSAELFLGTVSGYLSEELKESDNAAARLAGLPGISGVITGAGRDRTPHADGLRQRIKDIVSDERAWFLSDTEGSIVFSGALSKGAGHECEFRSVSSGPPADRTTGKVRGYFAKDRQSGRPRYCAASALKDLSGRSVGFAVISFGLDELTGEFEKHPRLFVADRQGRVLLPNDMERTNMSLWPSGGTDNSVKVAAMLGEEPHSGQYVTLDGQQFLVTRQVIGKDGWSLISLDPTDHIRTFRLFAMFVSLVFYIAAVLLFSRMHHIRETSERITASERRYRSLVEGSPNCVMLFDTEGRCEAVNRAGIDLIGMPEHDILGKRLDTIWSEQGEKDINEIMKDILKGDMRSFVAESPGRGGETIVWNAVLNPVREQDGTIRRFVGIFMDVTERVKAEKEIEKTNSELFAKQAQLEELMKELTRHRDYLDMMVTERTEELSETNEQLHKEITERVAAEAELRRYNLLLRALSHVQSQFISDSDPRLMFEGLLENLLLLTGSEYGFIGEVLRTEGDMPYIRTLAISDISWDAETREMYARNVMNGLEFSRLDTLFGSVITSGEIVISNSPSEDIRSGGLPPGHPPLRSFLGMPFNMGKQLIGMACLANRRDGYDNQLIEYIRPFLDASANIIYACRNDQLRQKAEENLEERASHAALGAAVGASFTKGRTLRETLQGCAEAMVYHLDATLARIWTFNEEEYVLELQASAGLYVHIDGTHSRIVPGEMKIGRIAAELTPTITNSVVGDPQISDQAWAVREGIVSFAGLPLIVEERLVGVLAMFSRKTMSGKTLSALEAVSDVISVGIQRVKAERALHDSETRFRLLFDMAQDGILLLDPSRDGIIVDANISLCRMNGYSREELVGRPVAFLDYHEDAAKIPDLMGRLMQGEALTFEIRHVKKNGEIFPVEVSASQINIGGSPFILAIDRDISERKRSEESMRLFLKAFEEATDGIQITDPKGYIVFTNRAAAEIYGMPDHNFIGMHFSELNAESGIAERVILPAMQNTGRWSGELMISDKDGREFPVWLSVSLVTESGGEPIAMINIIRDITERKQAEEELSRHREHLLEMVEERTYELKTAVRLLTQEISFRKSAEETLKESEARFRTLSQEFNTLLDAIPDALMLLSPDLRILWANRGAAVALKMEFEELTGKECHRLWHNSGSACEQCPAAKSFISGTAEGLQFATADGRLWASRAYPIKDDFGRVTNVMLLNSDVTEKTNLEAEAMRAGHLASLGELSAGVAHEINNPINGIINYAQILVNKGPAGSSEQDISKRIIKEGERIASIVRSLLSFARERKEEKASAQVEKVLLDTITLTEAQIRKDGILLRIGAFPGTAEIVANAQQIQQVFLNLISNARYALNNKYPAPHPDKIFEIGAEIITQGDRPFLRTTFCDHGEGIPGDIIDKVMNPFFSTKPSGQGTGLGLSISHGIIKDHEGKITIESSHGNFTKVHVDLPLKV